MPQRKRLDAGPRLFSHYALGLFFLSCFFGLPCHHPPFKTKAIARWPSSFYPLVPAPSNSGETPKALSIAVTVVVVVVGRIREVGYGSRGLSNLRDFWGSLSTCRYQLRPSHIWNLLDQVPLSPHAERHHSRPRHTHAHAPAPGLSHSSLPHVVGLCRPRLASASPS